MIQLTCWLFWQRQQSLGGYASRSSVDRCIEILKTGIHSSSDIYLLNNTSDFIEVPDYVEVIDAVYYRLTHRNTLRVKYRMTGDIKENIFQLNLTSSSYEYYLKRAEIEVMVRI